MPPTKSQIEISERLARLEEGFKSFKEGHKADIVTIKEYFKTISEDIKSIEQNDKDKLQRLTALETKNKVIFGGLSLVSILAILLGVLL